MTNVLDFENWDYSLSISLTPNGATPSIETFTLTPDNSSINDFTRDLVIEADGSTLTFSVADTADEGVFEISSPSSDPGTGFFLDVNFDSLDDSGFGVNVSDSDNFAGGGAIFSKTTSISFEAAVVPVPSALPLFLTGFGLLAAVGASRRRRPAA